MMHPFFTPSQALHLTAQTGLMLAEAQMVITMRLLGLTGLRRVPEGEHDRMVMEKAEALVDSGLAATRALLAGNSVADVAIAALKPVRSRTRSNAARLALAD